MLLPILNPGLYMQSTVSPISGNHGAIFISCLCRSAVSVSCATPFFGIKGGERITFSHPDTMSTSAKCTRTICSDSLTSLTCPILIMSSISIPQHFINAFLNRFVVISCFGQFALAFSSIIPFSSNNCPGNVVNIGL